MSVYTPVDDKSLVGFLASYPVGKLIDFYGIAEGIENTNYLVTTTQGSFILTLFESSSISHINYALELMAYLANHLTCFAHPIANMRGDRLAMLANKPTTLVEHLPGHSIARPTPRHCQQIGAALAHLHLLGQNFPLQRDNPRGPQWRIALAEKLQPHLAYDEQLLLNDELLYQQAAHNDALPQGIIHADLFRDNALFDDDMLSGIIDLYNSGRDKLLYDLAITVNDWCTNPDGSLDADRLTTLVSTYQQIRPVSDEEVRAWPTLLRAAALRFWLSRLRNVHFPPPAALTTAKEPAVFRQLLENYRNTRAEWPLK